MLIESGIAARRRGDDRLPPDTVGLTAALSISAGIIHATSSVDHFREATSFGILFVLVAAFQVGWAAVVFRGASPGWLRAAVVVNLAVVAVWAVSRTLGLPFGPEPGTPEAVGIVDVVATIDELLLVLIAATVLPRTPGAVRIARFAVPAAGALAVASLLLTMVAGGHH